MHTYTHIHMHTQTNRILAQEYIYHVSACSCLVGNVSCKLKIKLLTRTLIHTEQMHKNILHVSAYFSENEDLIPPLKINVSHLIPSI